MVWIFDFRPPGVSRALRGWPAGSGFMQICSLRGLTARGGQPRKSKQGDSSSRMSSRDSMIRIFDLDPSRAVVALPVGVATACFFVTNWLKTRRNG